jgi:hypothetical protein
MMRPAAGTASLLQTLPLIFLSLVLLICNLVLYTKIQRLQVAVSDRGFSQSPSLLDALLSLPSANLEAYSRDPCLRRGMDTIPHLYRV